MDKKFDVKSILARKLLIYRCDIFFDKFRRVLPYISQILINQTRRLQASIAYFSASSTTLSCNMFASF